MRRLIAKLYNSFRRAGPERELEREIASHLALIEDDFERRGMHPDAARLAARRAYGGVERAKELHRDERSLVWIEQGLRDLRHAARNLGGSPGFTLVAVITLALGIGVNTTLFTAYNSLALKPLPVADPDEVVRVKRWFDSGARGDVQFAFSYPEYVYCRDHNNVFSSLVAASWPLPVLSGPERLTGQLVSANYFGSLGIGARLGRTFEPEEDRSPGSNAVIVLSYPFWQRKYGGNSEIVGRILKLNGMAFTIIGVTPESFTGTAVFTQIPNFWAPLSMQPRLAPGSDWLHTPEDHRFQMLGRLTNSATQRGAQAEIDGLVHQYVRTYKERDATRTVTLQPTRFLAEADDIRFQAFVAALMLIVGMVLLVACANLANMLLARGAARQRDIGIRLALGAGRVRVIRLLLTESILLSLAGGAVGVVLSLWTSRLLWIAISQTLGGPDGTGFLPVNLSPDARVFGYALLLSIGTGILFGLSPALRSTRTDLSTALKDEGTPFGARLSRSRLRSLLVSGQVALSMVLLVIAGFLTRGLLRSRSVNTGFETRHLFVLAAEFGRDGAKAAARQQSLVDRLRTLPQLSGVAPGGVPMMGTWTPLMIARGVRTGTLASYASADYFETLGIHLVRGRSFRKDETEKAPQTLFAGTRFTRQSAERAQRVAVISESTARLFWPVEDALGKRFQLDMDFRGTLAEFEVVGIAQDIRYANLTRIDPAHVYLAGYTAGSHAILVRAQGDGPSAVAALRKQIESFDPDLLPSLDVIGMEEGPLRLQKSLANAYGMFAVTLAALALALAAVGIHGVMSYLVSRRVREIGIRMALGAMRGAVLQAVVLQGLRPVLLGIVFGIAAGAALSSTLHATLMFPGSADLLYGVPFYDPPTFLGLACFLAGIAAIASWIPALRALRVDPMTALRHE